MKSEVTFGLLVLICTLTCYNYAWAQSPQDIIKITSPILDQKVPIGVLSIEGTSSDDINSDCTVYVGLNDLEPIQKAIAIGPGGQSDYSSWTFTYATVNHQVELGANKLTARLSCPDSGAYSSVNINGVSPESGFSGNVSPERFASESGFSGNISPERFASESVSPEGSPEFFSNSRPDAFGSIRNCWRRSI